MLDCYGEALALIDNGGTNGKRGGLPCKSQHPNGVVSRIRDINIVRVIHSDSSRKRKLCCCRRSAVARIAVGTVSCNCGHNTIRGKAEDIRCVAEVHIPAGIHRDRPDYSLTAKVAAAGKRTVCFFKVGRIGRKCSNGGNGARGEIR